MTIRNGVFQLWQDERAIVTVESMLLVVAISSLGAIVGLVTLRDHIVQQLGDSAVALDHLDQSFEYNLVRDGNGNGNLSDDGDFELSGSFRDSSTLIDATGQPPACMNISLGPTPES